MGVQIPSLTRNVPPIVEIPRPKCCEQKYWHAVREDASVENIVFAAFRPNRLKTFGLLRRQRAWLK
jgi:hypothetical protein